MSDWVPLDWIVAGLAVMWLAAMICIFAFVKGK